MRESLSLAIRETIFVPPHVKEAANACGADLMHGPQYSVLPDSGEWKDFGEEHWAPLASDLEGNSIHPVYSGPVGDLLREFIADLPATLYADEDQEHVASDEPTGEEVDGEWFEPAPYYEIGHHQIVEALFGSTISKEFR